jgi:hypothetical protein
VVAIEGKPDMQEVVRGNHSDAVDPNPEAGLAGQDLVGCKNTVMPALTDYC